MAINKYILRIKEIALLAVLLLAPQIVGAESAPGDGVFTNPLGVNSLPLLLAKLLDIAVMIGTPLLAIGIVYTGFLFVTAAGNEQKITKAKEGFFWAIIGGAVLLGAKVIATVISTTIGAIPS